MATDVIPIPALAPDLNSLTSNLLGKESVPLKPQPPKLMKMPDHSYSRVEMMRLKEHPRSKLRPSCLELAYFTSKGKNPGVWDPEHWHAASRGGERGDKEADKRAFKNDRGKEEELKGDEFILTPQRRSFVSGCHVSLPLAPPPAPATLVPLAVEKEVRGTGLSSAAGVGGRRVGSGRVGQDRERENVRREWPERANNDRNGALDRERTERSRGVREFEDRRFQREDRGERRYGRDDYGRYSSRRNHHHEEEPEWFSGGPLSQSDTIELKGFDEEDKKKKGKNEKEMEKDKREAKSPLPAAQGAKEKLVEDGPPLTNGKQSRPPSQAEPRPLTPPPAKKEHNAGDFSMEDILKMEIPMGEEMLEVCAKSSRFSQWFNGQDERKSPTNLMRELGLREAFKEASAPPAPPVAAVGPEMSLMSLLNRNKPRVMRAEQLERENAPAADMGAFQQLIAQLGGADSKPPSQAPPPIVPQPRKAAGSAVDPRGLALMQLLGAKANAMTAAAPPTVGPAHPALRHAPTEEDILAGRVQPGGPPPAHLLQQQQQQLSALANQQLQQRAMAPSVLPPTLQRPEALAMIRAVQNGEASRQQLYHQLQQAAMMRQRGPTPDAAFSYLLLQNALEEQAKQLQQQQAQQQPAQPARIAMAFTPTSVIRKMTADKDGKQRHHVSGASTPDVNAERKNTDTPPPVHSSAEPVSKPSKPVGQPTGRTASQMANFVAPQAQVAQPRPVSKPDPGSGGNSINDVAAMLLEQQQQHQMLAAAMSAAAAAAAHSQQPRTMPTSVQAPSQGHLFRQNQPPPPTYVRPPPFANVPPMFLPPQAPPPSVLAQQQRAANAQLQQLLRQHNAGTSRPAAGTGGTDLARWFTPELLSAGAGITHGRQGLAGHKVLSLEELERQQAAMPH